MIAGVRGWYSSRRAVTKIALGVAVAFVALVGLYVAARTAQYANASRTSAGLYVPEGADLVVRVSDLAGKWKQVRQTELWKSFTKKLQKDPGVRKSLNELLSQLGAPTIDNLEDRRWLERNPLMSEASILKYAGRDVAFALTGDKFCVATRVGLWEYLLLPGLNLFPGAVGARRLEDAWALRRGDLYISVQGALLVASNDPALLASALRRNGVEDSPASLLHATLRPEPFLPTLRGFPVGAFLAVGDIETCRHLHVDAEITGANLVLRAKAEGMKPRQPDPAPVETVGYIPEKGLGACVTNIDAGPFWDWWRKLGERRARAAPGLGRLLRESVRELVEILESQRFGQDLVPKLDGPVSVLLGASQGEDGRTYAATAFYLRSTQPREAGEALQGIIDRGLKLPRREVHPIDDEAGGVAIRSFRFEPDPFRFNNYLTPSYAVTADALILSNNREFLADVLRCRANEGDRMAVQRHYVQAMQRLHQLGMTRVMSAGTTASFFLYGPALRQGLEGFYGSVASQVADTPQNKQLMRQEIETAARQEGHPIRPAELDDHVRRKMDERIQAQEEELRARARILDYLNWLAFQAETVEDGMKFDFALELK